MDFVTPVVPPNSLDTGVRVVGHNPQPAVPEVPQARAHHVRRFRLKLEHLRGPKFLPSTEGGMRGSTRCPHQ